VNLCINAGHAMKKHGGILDITLEEVDYDPHQQPGSGLPPGSYLKLTVSDTGCGMPSDIQEHIFDPFFTTKEIGEGIGLGLAVVHGIINSHHGGITIESEPGKGTTFQIFFPVTEEVIPQEMHTKDESDVKEGNEHILLVEDEPALLKVYKTALIQLGYHITTQNNGVEALDTFRANPDQFDMVLTDQAMPHMTGEQLSQELLNLRPDIPIILMTGYSDSISEKRAQALGIRRFLKKPFKLVVLAHVIRKIFAIKQRRDGEMERWSGGELENFQNSTTSSLHLSNTYETHSCDRRRCIPATIVQNSIRECEL
jgi:CheY-like chemotaxis protein